MEVLVKADEFDLIPAHPDPGPEPSSEKRGAI
jgi:hypothetical protein